MALIDLKTDLKSLKYGKDTVDGGDSKLPLVKTPIPESFSQIGNTGGFDSTLRGGALIGTAITNDSFRIGKLINTLRVPQGAAFKTKMNLLSNMNVKTQVDTQKHNQGEYRTLNTLAQVATDPFGYHYPLFSGPISYYDAVKSQQIGDQSTGRLVDFYNTKINTKVEGTELYSYDGGPGSQLGFGKTVISLAGNRTGRNNPKLIDFYGDAGERNPLFDQLNTGDLLIGNENPNTTEPEFIVNPKIALGFQAFKRTQITALSSTVWASGVTNLLYSPSDNQASNNLKTQYKTSTAGNSLPLNNQGVLSNPKAILSNRASIPYLFNQEDLYNPNLVVFGEGTQVPNSFTDFRKTIKDKPENKNVKLTYSNYSKFSRAKTSDPGGFRPESEELSDSLYLGNPGTKFGMDRSIDPSSASGSNAATADWVNLSGIEKAAKPSLADSDFVPFYVSILRYDGSRDTIQFRAFVKSFSDDYNADWKGYKYLGRGEDFYNYNGFSRSIKLSFTVHAQTKAELLRQYQKLNILAASLTPDYSGAGIMRGNFMELTFGDYIVQTPGILKAISFSIPDSSPYDIGRDKDGKVTGKGDRLAHIIEVGSFDFTPIHKFIPRRSSKYISLGPDNVGWKVDTKTGDDQDQQDNNQQNYSGGEQGEYTEQVNDAAAASATAEAAGQENQTDETNTNSDNQGTDDWGEWEGDVNDTTWED